MGGGGSTEQQSSTQSMQQTQLPPWINQAAQQNYALAQNIAEQPFQQYQGQQVAGVGPQMQQGWNLAAQSGNAGADQYNASQAGYLTAMNGQVTPGSVTPGQLSSTSLSPYMNPYTQSVINTTLPIMQQNLMQNQNQMANAAASANAFGGDRQAIQQGVTQAQGALGMGQMAAQLNAQNFQQAQAAAQYDINNRMQAGEFNVGQGMQAQQANLNALLQGSQGLAGLGSQAQQNQRQQFLELSTAGGQEQQQAQNEINAQMGKFNQAVAYPGQQLGVLQSALGMTPYGSTTIGSSSTQAEQQTNPSLMADIQSGLQGLGGMFGSGGPLAPMMSAMFPGSDRALKTDIQQVGVHPPTGLPLYSYRYKGDPKSYPKITGPMAEDAMQVAPHAVKTVGVHGPTGQALHTVDMNALNMTPAIRPTMPGTTGSFATRVPGALTPRGAPAGLNGPLGANMRPPKMRPQTRMPRVAGAMGGSMTGI